MADGKLKNDITIEVSSVNDEPLEDISQPRVIESHLPGNSFFRVMQDLLSFDSQIEREFLTINTLYRYTCGDANCKFSCGVPHLTLVVRVRGLADDQIGIVLHSAGKAIVNNILPKPEELEYSYKTWRDSRWHIIRRMVLCLHVYYLYGDLHRIYILTARPLHNHIFIGVMGKILNLQKWVFQVNWTFVQQSLIKWRCA